MKDEATKRTTIVLEKNNREFLEKLIAEGKERGIKPFISKMFDIYRSMAIYDWKYPGEYYHGSSRIAFVSHDVIRIITEFIPVDKLQEAGGKIGSSLRHTIQVDQGIDVTKRENWSNLFKRLRILGYGDFDLHDKFLVVKNPFLDVNLFLGFLQELIGCPLEVKTYASPFIFEIKEGKSH